jgi:serine/threonine protein phosphatase PrpC
VRLRFPIRLRDRDGRDPSKAGHAKRAVAGDSHAKARDARQPFDLATAAPQIGELSPGLTETLPGTNVLRLPMITADAGSLGDFWVAGASLSGLSHRHSGTTGQDSYSFRSTEHPGTIVLVVADGLGSKSLHAQVGATLASRVVADSLGRRNPEQLAEDPIGAIERAMETANAVISTRFGELGASNVKDLSTVLVTAVIRDTLGGGARATIARLGDCGAFRLSESGAVSSEGFSSIFSRDDGPVNVVRSCLPTESPVTPECHEVDLVIGDVLVLTTDGLADDILDSPSARGWLAGSWGKPCSGFQMLDSLRFRRQGSHDDRTALAVWLDS